MAGALDGLLVVSLEQAVAAPFCTQRLADAGARVIKIEREGGETARHYDAAVQGASAYFVWLNRGKESAVLDLKSTQDMDLFLSILSRADVLVQNLIPGALARMGLDSSTLTARFPRLIVANIGGYGQDTPYAGNRAYDMLVQAESGLAGVTGTPDDPCKIGVSAADISTGMTAYSAVLEALIARGITGRGRYIDIAMFDVMADWMAVPLLHLEQAGRETHRHGLNHAVICPYGPMICADGTLVVAVQTNAEWQRFCATVLLNPDLAQDPRFATNPKRVANRGALDHAIAPIVARISVEQMIARLEAGQIAWGRLSTMQDLSNHPALRRVSVALPDGTSVSLPRPPARDAQFASGAVPDLGTATARLRAEFTG
jgi:crotonobetainyl-CoA:carnitine CoA-transferase CaiB-like acyl-CoA transferase